MTPLAVGRNFEAFETVTTGNGSIDTGSNGALTVTSASGDSAYVRIRIQSSPGMKVRVSCWVKRISGSGGGVFIDFPAQAAVKSRVDATSGEWELCSAEAVANPTSSLNDYFQIAIGAPGAAAGEYKLCLPSVEVEGGSHGFAMARLAGLIAISTDDYTASLNGNFFQTGIESVEWDDENTQLVVNTSFRGASGMQMAPIIHTEFTHDRGGQFFMRSGAFNRATGSFEIRFYDGTNPAGNRVKLPQNSGMYYIWVLGFGIG